MKKITFLIRSLAHAGGGGAEKQLIILAKALSLKGYDVTILCFYPDAASADDLRETPIKLVSLEKKNRWDFAGFFWKLVHTLKSIQPDILHSYLPDANLISILLKPFLPETRIVWGIRHSDWGGARLPLEVDQPQSRWTKFTLALERRSAQHADLIIANSEAGQKYHLSKGFPAETMIVIPNGIDVDRFQPDLESGKAVRQAWGISANAILVGIVGRLHPMKDHATFLNAAALLAQAREDVRFVCVGGAQAQDYARKLYQLSDQLGIAEKVVWAGARVDMPAVYNALDILVSASAYGEGFPNVIGEAMACEKPCVVTNVGDSAWIVGNEGIVVPPQNPLALKTAVMQTIVDLTARNKASSKIRQRIVENFSVPQLLLNTENALLSLFYASKA